jgi:hypothetical protein
VWVLDTEKKISREVPSRFVLEFDWRSPIG